MIINGAPLCLFAESLSNVVLGEKTSISVGTGRAWGWVRGYGATGVWGYGGTVRGYGGTGVRGYGGTGVREYGGMGVWGYGGTVRGTGVRWYGHVPPSFDLHAMQACNPFTVHHENNNYHKQK